jgi:hypothetical protein
VSFNKGQNFFILSISFGITFFLEYLEKIYAGETVLSIG